MHILVNKLINMKNIDSQKQFEEEFNEWLAEKGYISQNEQSMILPESASAAQVGSGTAVFHREYSPDVNSLTTKRRYFLARTWDSNLPVMTLFGMNPSTAASCSNDNTVEFMIKVAKKNGCGSLYIVNTSPYIKSASTTKNDFVLDEEAWEYIQFAIEQSSLVVLGWGENGQKFGISRLSDHYPLRSLLAAHSSKLRVFDFGGQKSGKIFPKHPLQWPPYSEGHSLKELRIEEFNRIIPI
ncbi:DUF1643 domain-containing protein [Jeotgalibacillus terrae]|uniref:DUF1643 domain-containing protein n=1 Tax=Jeotgalibacillus terrae TaxID=587735 RepID=A0ABW5ZKH5_9BACL|nr:DUF1643 domain-containing protein [Jeotgalibacillus terrae]MBM7578204.1 hypothetical protein [Jeotgalibacillus terrae]